MTRGYTGCKYLSVRLKEIANHGRKAWLFSRWGWTVCIIREARK